MTVWSEIKSSDLRESVRLDAEYQKPQDRLLEKRLLESGARFLRPYIIGFCSGKNLIQMPEQLDGMVGYLRTQNVRELIISEAGQTYVAKAQSCVVNQGDLLAVRVGAGVGDFSVVGPADSGKCISDNVLRLRFSGLNPFYLCSFLACRFGRQLLNKNQKGTARGLISKENFFYIPIPHMELSEQLWFEENFLHAEQLSKQSKGLYQRAQQMVESELQLDKLAFEKPIGYSASISDVVTTNRIDAQCFRPDYRVFPDAFKKREHFNRLGQLVLMLKGKQMGEVSKGSLSYGSIKDVDRFEFDTEGYCIPGKSTRIADKHDLLLAITGATIGKIGIVERYDSLAFSGDLLALKTRGEIDPFYLLAVMLSPAGQNQCQRWITGSTNGHLAPSDVAKIIIPRLDEGKEAAIAEMLRESLNKKHGSEALLEQGKTRVEQLIKEAIAS